MTANNCFTTIVVEQIVITEYTFFYWRKINECRTRFIGRYDTQLCIEPDTKNQVWKSICDEVARLTDGTFIGILQ
jgi:hypothetical protein